MKFSIEISTKNITYNSIKVCLIIPATEVNIVFNFTDECVCAHDKCIHTLVRLHFHVLCINCMTEQNFQMSQMQTIVVYVMLRNFRIFCVKKGFAILKGKTNTHIVQNRISLRIKHIHRNFRNLLTLDWGTEKFQKENKRGKTHRNKNINTLQ